MYGQSARKYPESSGLNAAGHPIIHQLDNVGERPIVPSSRMSSQAMQPQQLEAHYPSAFPGPLAGPSTFPGSNAFPGFSAFPSPSAFSGPSTFSGPGSIYPVPSAVDTFLGPTSNYPFHPTGNVSIQVSRELTPSKTFLSVLDANDQSPSICITPRYHDTHPTDHAFITGMDVAVLHQRRPLTFRGAPYPNPHTRQINANSAQPTIAPYAELRATIAENAGLTKLRPGELVRGAEFSTGVIRVSTIPVHYATRNNPLLGHRGFLS